MIESRLQATITWTQCENNPFYGKCIRTTTINDSLTSDKDERRDVCPFGVIAKVRLPKTAKDIEFKITPHYFDIDDSFDGWYSTTFTEDDTLYLFEMYVEDDKIDTSETCIKVYDVGDYIDGNDDDVRETIYAKDFESIEPWYC